ncbi:efflux RND transporter periplasmic adaptor subunit [Roseinatronobacter sp. NSM]|uniref:efflux RND transporter periplasmic adaptor subunit n=1 Tax=Roseinatronobacter sp. NSM TaxID=3457785 RepID=UPI0040362C31
MLKRFIIAALLLVVLGGGLVGFNLFRDQMIAQFLANRPVQALPVETIEVRATTWSPVLNAIGTVNAAQGVELTVEAAGIVREIGFQSNADVAEGDILLRLDDEVQRADLNAAQSQLALEQLNLDRALELQSRGVTANVQLDQARAAFDVASAQVARAQAVIQQRRLVAPFAGIVGLPRVDVGQHIAPGTIVATLQELDQMRVDFSLPEQALPSLSIGQGLDIRVQGDDRRFRGEIRGIDPRVDPNSRMVSLRGTVENPDRALTPGQFARIEIRLPQEDGVIALPQNAVVTSLYGDFAYVVRPSEDDADQLVVRQTFVTTGRRNNGVVEIIEGISDGDRVVSAGQNRLSNRAPVTLADTTTPQVAQ